jgi:SAM-dependent methyltransferase
MIECPFCGTRSPSFLTFGLDEPVLRERQVVGGGHRADAMCPHGACSSLDRERLVYLFLQRANLPRPEARVLHVAPEGNLSDVLSRCARYVAADLVPFDGIIEMDVTRIQYPDESFDAVICNHVLEHVADDRAAIGEIRRVLAPGGFAILQVPISSTSATTFEDAGVTAPADRARVFGQRDHVRIYGQDYPDRLRAAGFGVTIHNAREEFGDEGCERYGLLKEENLFFCTSRV